ncbi:response regulator (plasmid) [Streptomyces sp. BI20]|uniref:response regulator n=1 Tax=Streptomyces sp. BI20 TaxID=3403460 RepID=UPI003C75F387
MAELRPLPATLSDEARSLATALRHLFTGLNISIRRYGARVNRDPSTISRYLSGTRHPGWDVVDELITTVAEVRGMPATPEAIELIQGLHQAAAAASGAGTPTEAVQVIDHHVADMSQALRAADRASLLSTVQGDALGEALLDRRTRIAALEVQLSTLRSESSTAYELLEVKRERDALRDEAVELKAQLEKTARLHADAEARCQLLEEQLALLEPVARTAALPAAPGGPLRPEQMPKILIVDDQPDNLLAITAVLATLNQELITVPSGQEALKKLLLHDDFAVIIMDVQMPDMDGYETVGHIRGRERTRSIPIIFLTAMGPSPEHSARGYAAGAVDYIVKPFDPWALRAKVTAFTNLYLERHR